VDNSTKEELLRQFQTYLEQVPDHPAEELPEERIDLYSLFSELAGLKSEVRIESRQLKAALDDFRDAFAALDGANRNLSARFEELQQEKKNLEKAALKPVVTGLLDVYDRLAAAAAQEEPLPARSFFAGFCRREREWIRLQAEGQRMTLRRLLDVLAQCGVQPVEAENRMFDPRFMKAAGADNRPGLAEGAVVSELSKGFTWDGSPLRAAEVIVNKLQGKQSDE
jgi:molecular chaperone GrpE